MQCQIIRRKNKYPGKSKRTLGRDRTRINRIAEQNPICQCYLRRTGKKTLDNCNKKEMEEYLIYKGMEAVGYKKCLQLFMKIKVGNRSKNRDAFNEIYEEHRKKIWKSLDIESIEKT